ncbi:MAG: cation:proton antiporter [Ferruginibacter sp.]|nr:cation:proton antiporter [Ferruginibacter sp.]
MKKFKNTFFYVGVISVFSALIYWTMQLGKGLEAGRNIVIPDSGKTQWMEFAGSLKNNLEHPLAILLVQILTIILAARLLGWVCKKIGQPTVIGEIAAGILLGPSFVGMYFPGFSAALFPPQSLGNLQFLSQIGLILFMFVIGMELDLKVLRNQAKEAVVISHASIVIPFALGLGLAYFIYENFAPKGIQFASFGLFLGIAMSITAFPVLARIVQERGINKTRLGTVVITCAATDDITAWCLLAAVIAIVKAGSFVSAIYIIFLAAAYVLVMLKVIRPFLKRVGDLHTTRENLSRPVVAIFFLILILSSYATEIIGIHALFGAFMAGAIMPENMKFRSIFIEKVEDVSLVLLLPLFFVFTGLRTEIGLLNDPYLWKVCGLIIVVAVAGKFIGSALAAKFVGQNWKDSLTIGALMNTRGLMELVVLNIGYDLGVLTPEIFAMMVIMALVTTFMTGPALDLINFIFKKKDGLVPQIISQANRFAILLSFGNPETGKSLLRLANALVRKAKENSSVTAMHLSSSNELHAYNIDEYEKESFAPVIAESKHLNQKITTFFKASIDIDSDIAGVANKGNYDLLLVGFQQSIFEGSLLGKVLGFTARIINPNRFINKVTGKEKLFENTPFDERTQLILSKTEIPVGILIDKNLSFIKRVFIPVFDAADEFLFTYAQKMITNTGARITLMDMTGNIKNDEAVIQSVAAIEKGSPGYISILSEVKIERKFLQQYDLMLISVDGWKKLLAAQSLWLNYTPSNLILKP